MVWVFLRLLGSRGVVKRLFTPTHRSRTRKKGIFACMSLLMCSVRLPQIIFPQNPFLEGDSSCVASSYARVVCPLSYIHQDDNEHSRNISHPPLQRCNVRGLCIMYFHRTIFYHCTTVNGPRPPTCSKVIRDPLFVLHNRRTVNWSGWGLHRAMDGSVLPTIGPEGVGAAGAASALTVSLKLNSLESTFSFLG